MPELIKVCHLGIACIAYEHCSNGECVVRDAVAAEREACSVKAREFAGHYSEGSDGRNTFILLAEWIERRDRG